MSHKRSFLNRLCINFNLKMETKSLLDFCLTKVFHSLIKDIRPKTLPNADQFVEYVSQLPRQIIQMLENTYFEIPDLVTIDHQWHIYGVYKLFLKHGRNEGHKVKSRFY